MGRVKKNNESLGPDIDSQLGKVRSASSQLHRPLLFCTLFRLSIVVHNKINWFMIYAALQRTSSKQSTGTVATGNHSNDGGGSDRK